MKGLKFILIVILLQYSIHSIGQNLTPLGSGLRITGIVNCMEYDSLNERMFVAGNFTQVEDFECNNIVWKDSLGWHAFGSGTTGAIYAMKYVNDRLYVGGYLTSIDGVTVNRICYWDSTGWHDMDGGVSGAVNSIEYYDSALYVSGTFLEAGGTTVNGIAKWDGQSWSATGTGSDVLNVYLQVLDTLLYAYGPFTNINGVATKNIVAFDGNNWSSRSLVASNLFVNNITLFMGQLYASIRDASTNKSEIRYYNNGTWTVFADNLIARIPNPLIAYHDTLYFFSSSLVPDPVDMFILKFSPTGNPIGGHSISKANSEMRLEWEFAKVINDVLLIGGQFRYFDGEFAGGIVAIDSTGPHIPFHTSTGFATSWYNSFGYSLYHDTIQNKLYAGGMFDFAGDTIANSIACWDGTKWSPLGDGFNGVDEFKYVRRITEYNNLIYAAGNFTKSGNKTVNGVATWNGLEWDSVGSGANNIIRDMVVYKNKLYLAGYFDAFNGLNNANGIIKFNGTAWSKVSALTNNGNITFSMCVHDGKLLVAGSFDFSGTTAHLVSFDGTTWSPFPSPVPVNFYRMISLNNNLYVSAEDAVYKYDGSTWSVVYTPPSNFPATYYLSSFDDAVIIGDLDEQSTSYLNTQDELTFLVQHGLINYAVPLGADSAYITGYLETPYPSTRIMNHIGILKRQGPSTQFTFSTDSICDHEYVSYSSTISDIYTAYDWTFPGGIPNSSTWFSPSIKYSVPGTYDVKYKVTNAFGSDSVLFQDLIFVGNCTLGLNEDFTNDFSAYPNPVTENLTIQLPLNASITQLAVFDVLGKLEYILNDFSESNIIEVDFSQLPKGIHFLKLSTRDNTYISKVVKN